MKDYKFSLIETLRFSFYTLIEHFAFFLAVMLIYIGIIVVTLLLLGSIITLPFINSIMNVIKVLDTAGIARSELIQNVVKYLGAEYSAAIIISLFFMYLLKRYMDLGFTKISINFYDHKFSEISTLFCCYNLIIKDAIASILYCLMCSIGLIFFIFPGVYCAVTFGLYHQCIVDEHLGPLAALQKSAELTYGSKWQLFALSILLTLLNYAAFAVFGITLLISWPLSSLAYAYAYRKLQAA